MGKFVNKFDEKLLITDKKNYSREQMQSFMTGPEWRNVEMAEEFASFVKEGNSLFYFPYFSQILDLWKIVGQSYKAARKYDSNATIWFATDYMMMDIFIGFFTTLELLPKGIASFLIRPFLKKENDSEMQNHLGDYFEKYANKLHTVPFYDHPYDEERKALSAAYRECKNKTWTDRLSWFLISTDLWARKWISKPLHYWFHQETNLVAATTDVIVKYNTENITDSETAKEQFQSQLQKAKANEKVKCDIVNEEVFAEKKPAKNYTAIYARLRVPRYDDFQPTLKSLSDNNIHVKKIASHDRVQIKCVVNSDNNEHLLEHEKKLHSQSSAKYLYSYIDRIHPYKKTLMFDAPAKNLQQTVDELKNCEGTQVKFIHNF